MPLASWAGDPPPDKSGFSLFDPVPEAQLRAFSPDRPTKANGPFTVDAGHFQYETDFAVYSRGNQDGARLTGWTAFDPLLKLGLTDRLDAELQVTGLQSATQAAGGASTTARGMGDTIVRAKWNLEGNDGGDRAAALLPYLKIPTAPSSLGNGSVEGGLMLPAVFNLPGGYALAAMPEVDFLRNSSGGGRHATVDLVLNASHALDSRWTASVEWWGSWPLRSGERTGYSADAALAFAVTPSVQLDVGANYGLNGTAPRVQVYCGLSQRF
jgi:hypothetical protein